MSAIPQAVLSENFEERLRGRRLLSAVFTTYQFDPSFFEQEILPVFLDIPLSHVAAVRLVQLEQEIPKVPGGIAVYYDVDGLIGIESPRLDFRRIPIRFLHDRRRQGVFHAKCVFLLVEEKDADETGHRAQALLAAVLSSNLTRSGWWSNVEVCHVEEIPEGGATRVRDELVRFLRWLERRAPAEGDSSAEAAQRPVRLILKFLSGTEQRAYRSSGEGLRPHFYSGPQSIPDFLQEVAGERISGTYLEVISPFFDDTADCQPLKDLIERFEPKEVRVFLPRSRAGDGLMSQNLYQSVRELRNVTWAKLPRDILKLGPSNDAGERFVHAKVYRFFVQKPRQEILFVGSPNLTRPAHQRGGNIETGFLIETKPAQNPEFWLEVDSSRPEIFKPRSERDEEGLALGGSRLQLRYHWDTGHTEGLWEGGQRSGRLRLECRSVTVGEVGPLESQSWTPMTEELADSLPGVLKESAFIKVYEDGREEGLLLVQEEGMASKPSLLLSLSVADILRYWSLLTAEQRAAFIESKGQELAVTGEGAALVARFRIEAEKDTLFDRFAGYFHAFACLERSVRAALSSDNDREASYRLFGRKHDSLGTLLGKLFETNNDLDDVERYVILMCAKQLGRQIKREFPDFWKRHEQDASELEEMISQGAEIRLRLISRAPGEMLGFLEWFDRWFLKKASPEEAPID